MPLHAFTPVGRGFDKHDIMSFTYTTHTQTQMPVGTIHRSTVTCIACTSRVYKLYNGNGQNKFHLFFFQCSKLKVNIFDAKDINL